jgi:hypothetical protein
MKKLALIATLFLVTPVATAAEAAGGGCSTCTSGSAVPGSRYLTLRIEGQSGPLALYDMVTSRRHVSLPSGLVSADGTTFVSATKLGSGGTRVTRYALPSGRVVATGQLPGRQSLVAVSPDGRRLLLQFVAQPGSTRYAVVDGMRMTRGVSLRGNYEVETLSPDGRRMFLVHWGDNGRYDLRNYDLRTNRLATTPTRSSETGAVEKMQGVQSVGLASRDGAWLHTLYVKGRGVAFVHALDLRAGVGHCIDLELPAVDPTAIGAAALTLSPDERTLYIAMPLAGRVFSVDVGRLEVTHTLRFRRPALSALAINPSAAVTPNGRMLYAAAGTSLWALDTAAWRLTGPRAVGVGEKQHAMATGVSPDGRRVVVLRSDRKLVARDAATLRRID